MLLTSGTRTLNGRIWTGCVASVPKAGSSQCLPSTLSSLPATDVYSGLFGTQCWPADFWSLVFYTYIYIANALWEHLLCHGYSAGYFFFNLGMQINGMQRSEQVPCRSQGSALDTCGCFMDWWQVWMRKVSKTTGLQVLFFSFFF